MILLIDRNTGKHIAITVDDLTILYTRICMICAVGINCIKGHYTVRRRHLFTFKPKICQQLIRDLLRLVNTHVRKHLHRNLAEDLLRIRTVCLICYVWLIHNYVKHNLWIIDRHCSDKGYQILSGCTGSGRIIDLLCRTGLSADTIARHLCLSSGTFRYRCLQILPKQR